MMSQDHLKIPMLNHDNCPELSLSLCPLPYYLKISEEWRNIRSLVGLKDPLLGKLTLFCIFLVVSYDILNDRGFNTNQLRQRHLSVALRYNP